jgi:heat-inducible transcriptional repressor
MRPLDERKVRILHAIVSDYVSTTKPVGSERLIEAYNLGCKSATVRNEMAEMSELGYLTQPHTSAGRIPTDRGYRFYVDELMSPDKAFTPADERHIKKRYREARAEIDEIIQQTCRLLSEITSYPSIATDPTTYITTIQHVYMTRVSARHALVVVLFSTGHVEHSLMEMETVPPEEAMERISNYLNGKLAGRDAADISSAAGMPEVPQELALYRKSLLTIMTAIGRAAAALTERKVFIEGTNQILRQPEFQDVQKLEMLLNALEERNLLYSVLSRALNGYPATIIIGAENRYAAMQDCSVITSTYRIGDRTAGYLGVVGPTRMNYDRASAAVGFVAHSLSEVLTGLWMV